MPAQLLIFDLDGTLVDSAPDIVEAVNALMRERGRSTIDKQIITAAIGEGLHSLMQSVFPEVRSDAKALTVFEHDFQRHYGQHLVDKTVVFPGVENFLAKWPGQLAIVTNKNIAFARQVVTGLGLDRFPWSSISGADSFARKKPDPFPLQEAMRVAGVTPHETLMIGDGIPDMVAARRAGVHSIAIDLGYASPASLRAAGASLAISSYSELPATIARAHALPARMPSQE